MSLDEQKNPSRHQQPNATSPTASPTITRPEISGKDTPQLGSGTASSHHKDNDLSTPRTEASSPASEVDDADFDELVAAGGALATSQQSTSSAVTREENASGEVEEEEYEMMPPMMMSQTDHHIRQLDQGGELNEVAGSQSMLSQELMCQAVSSQKDEVSNEEDENDCGAKNCHDGGLEVRDIQLSQQTETSIGMAVRLGLLSQTQDDDADSADEMAPEGNLNLVTASEEYSTRSRVSGFDLLTRAGRKDAAALMAFSQEHPTSANTSQQELSDTPIRESEGFGSLLDAVAKITEQEEVVETLTPTWEAAVSSLDHASLSPSRNGSYLRPPFSSKPSHRRPKSGTAASRGNSPTRERQLRKSVAADQKRRLKLPESKTSAASSTSAKKSKAQPSKSSKSGRSSKVSKTSSSSAASGIKKAAISTIGSPSAMRKATTTSSARASPAQMWEAQKKSVALSLKTEQKEKELEILNAQAEAKRAAELAERTISDHVIAKRLLLSMALVRENPRSVPEVLPSPGHILQEGFFWAHYPPLELVLKRHMMEYYELSTTKCQSAQQQAFNNDMVVVVQEVCTSHGWKFAECFDSKGLRDRIRCYYKTHIQNAKKRLRTMVRNPTKRANARHLCEHLDLIEKHNVASASGEAHDTTEPKQKKQRLDADRKTSCKDQKSPAKTNSNASGTVESPSDPLAPDSARRDCASFTSPEQATGDQQDPKGSSDPLVTPKMNHEQGINQGMTTTDSSSCCNDGQSPSVASGTRRRAKGISSPLSPLVI